MVLELRTKAGVNGLNEQGIVKPVMIFCLRMSWGLLRAAEQSNTTETRVPEFRVDAFSRLAVWARIIATAQASRRSPNNGY